MFKNNVIDKECQTVLQESSRSFGQTDGKKQDIIVSTVMMKTRAVKAKKHNLSMSFNFTLIRLPIRRPLKSSHQPLGDPSVSFSTKTPDRLWMTLFLR